MDLPDGRKWDNGPGYMPPRGTNTSAFLAVLSVKGRDWKKHSLGALCGAAHCTAVKSRGPGGGDQENSATDVKYAEQFLDTVFHRAVLVVMLLLCLKHLGGNCIKGTLRSLPSGIAAWIPCMSEGCKTPLQIHVFPSTFLLCGGAFTSILALTKPYFTKNVYSFSKWSQR